MFASVVALLMQSIAIAAPAPAVPADKEKFHGVWKIESIDTGEEKGPPREIFEKMRLGFTGDRLYMYQSDTEYQTGSFVIDPTQSPRHITLTQFDDKGEPRQVRGEVKKDLGIYKLDGDKLMLAVLEGKGDRPKEFKAVPWKKPEPGKEPDLSQGTVMVLTLVKTSETMPEFKKKPAPPAPKTAPAPPEAPKTPEPTIPPLPALKSP